jgi:hypothetical protein
MIVDRVISGYAYNIIKRILPKISMGETAPNAVLLRGY